jgi:hypothetical protein
MFFSFSFLTFSLHFFRFFLFFSFLFFLTQWTDEEEAEVHGPFTAQQMLDWKEQGFFGAGGVLARELGKGDDTLFYNTNRIDFDLFT